MARYLPKQTGKYTYDNNTLVASEIGLTVEVDRESVRVMSDIWEMHTYAVCYDAEKDSFQKLYVNSDYGTTPAYAEVDAEPELLVRYAAWQVEKEAEAAGRRHAADLAHDLEELKDLARGRTVKVVRGRKVPVGTTGRIYWYGEGRYGMRVGIELLSGEKIFVDGRNIEVQVDPAEAEEIETNYAASAVEKAAHYAEKREEAVAKVMARHMAMAA